MPREIQIVHLQRSGGHALMGWICQQLRGKTVVLNDVASRYCLKAWKDNPIPEDVESAAHLVYNIEDIPMHGVSKTIRDAAEHIPIGRDPNPLRILLLRDPYNLFASRARYTGSCHLGNTSAEAVRCWTQYALRFFELRHGIEEAQTPSCIPVDFNAWAASMAYRRHLWDILRMALAVWGSAFTDEGRQVVSEAGDGSSFDGMKLNGRADEMKVNERHREFPRDFYEDLFDDTVFELAEAIWGMERSDP